MNRMIFSIKPFVEENRSFSDAESGCLGGPILNPLNSMAVLKPKGNGAENMARSKGRIDN